MMPLDLSNVAENDARADELMARLYPYIDAFVRRMARGTKIADLDLEIDDLIQVTLIKLWLRLKQRRIENPEAYIKSIVRNELIDMLRQHKPTVSLPVDGEGELYTGTVMVTPQAGMADPADEVEQEETVAALAANIADAVLSLPARQRQAMLSLLAERIDDVPQLVEAFNQRQVDVVAQWPEDKLERQRLLASLSVARKKVGCSMGIKQPEHDGAEKAPAVQRHEAPAASGDEPAALEPRNGSRGCAGMEAYIDKLREPYRRAVRLHCVEGHTYPQVADELNLPLGTAKSYISRGMKMLRRLREMGPGLHEAPEQETDIAGIVARVETLHEPYRTPVKLHYVQKRTYPQIARQLNLPKGTVKSYISRGMKMLRQSA